jgi:predicted porin
MRCFNGGSVNMKKIRVAAASAAVVILSGAGGAHAADLSTKAAVAPAGPTVCTGFADIFTTACQLSWMGVRFYGTIDTAGSFEQHFTPMDKNSVTGYFPLKDSRLGSNFVLAPNALSQSNIGVQIKEPIAAGWSFVGQLEMGFNPWALTIGNNTGSVHEGIGFSLLQQKTPADGSGNGQFYTDLGYAGISNDTWGTLTFGRQLDLGRESTIAYDPMGNALAFSYIGFFGANAGGGVTEDARSNTAIKYKVAVGNWHFGVLGQIGGYSNGNASQGAVQGNVGADFNVGPGVLTTDVTATRTKDAVTEGLAGGASGVTGVVNPNTPQALAVTIQDTESVLLGVKYTWDRLKLYAGYEWIQFAAPSDTITAFTDAGGTFLQAGVPLNGVPVGIASFAGTDKIQQTAWVGARYSLMPNLDVASAYYHSSFNNSGTVAQQTACAGVNTANGNCAGHVDVVSALVDWQFAPKWDTYAGVNWSHWTGGQASGFLLTTPGGTFSDYTVTGGLRFRW